MTATGSTAPDWRLRISMGLTLGWLLLGYIYISSVVGWSSFASQNAPSLGSFLEGAFAPLAFLWLVVGFFLQQQQLHDNTQTIREQLEEMRRSAAQAEVQARAIAADELHSRQDTFLRISEFVHGQLGMIGGWIITSYDAGTDERTAELWARVGRGESVAFSLDVIRRCFSGEVSAAELFYGTDVRRGHTERFCSAFERLTEAAGECDTYDLIADALRDGPHGRVYGLMVDSASEPREVARLEGSRPGPAANSIDD
jgi:hypothetical protein